MLGSCVERLESCALISGLDKRVKVARYDSVQIKIKHKRVKIVVATGHGRFICDHIMDRQAEKSSCQTARSVMQRKS